MLEKKGALKSLMEKIAKAEAEASDEVYRFSQPATQKKSPTTAAA